MSYILLTGADEKMLILRTEDIIRVEESDDRDGSIVVTNDKSWNVKDNVEEIFDALC